MKINLIIYSRNNEIFKIILSIIVILKLLGSKSNWIYLPVNIRIKIFYSPFVMLLRIK